MPTHSTRSREGRGRGPNERASIAIGSENLDKLATRGERSGTDISKQVRFLIEQLLEGRLLMINGMGEVCPLHPEGGVSEPLARMYWSQSIHEHLPKLHPQGKSVAAGDAGRRAEPATRR
jgi:hypothetical protein